MTPLQLSGWLRVTFDHRDREGFERGLALLERASTVPDIRTLHNSLPVDRLTERRGELLSELAAVNDAISRAAAARAGTPRPVSPSGPADLESSD